MLKGKKIMVTAGGTQEYIDDVRVMTNISSGKLGAAIASHLMAEDADVYYVCGKTAVRPQMNSDYLPADSKLLHIQEVRTALDAMEAMEAIVKEQEIDAVVHAMAVSDFTFKRDKAVKLKSNDAEGFIEFMRQTITKNPKIIAHIKQWRPETILIGFKFEVGSTTQDLLLLSRESIDRNKCDLVVANDKQQMTEAQDHVAHMVCSPWMRAKHNFRASWGVKGKAQIAHEICHFLIETLDKVQ